MKTNKTPIKIFNPFHWIAGSQALSIGIVGMLIIALLSSYSGVFFDGAIDIHLSTTKGNFPLHLYFQMSTWLLFSLLIYIAIRICSSTTPRVIDVLGTVAMSQLPLVLASLWGLAPFAKVGEFDPTMNLEQLTAYLSENILPLSLNIVVMMIIILWSLILKYNAFAVCGNAKGGKSF